jgi:hypothetical protein
MSIFSHQYFLLLLKELAADHLVSSGTKKECLFLLSWASFFCSFLPCWINSYRFPQRYHLVLIDQSDNKRLAGHQQHDLMMLHNIYCF